MTIKIDAPKSYYDNVADSCPFQFGVKWKNQTRVRIVRESDWRRIMEVVKQADDAKGAMRVPYGLIDAVDALRIHAGKRK